MNMATLVTQKQAKYPHEGHSMSPRAVTRISKEAVSIQPMKKPPQTPKQE